MKKIIFLIIILFALTACSDKKQSYNESNAPKAMDNFNQADIIDRMNGIKNGLTPKIKPSGVYRPAGDEEQAGSENQKKPASSAGRPALPTGRLEDLAAQYDSAIIKTNFGDISVKFYAQESPITVNNFMNLAKAGFYNGIKFHRVIKDFMIQGGDPNSKDDDWSNDGQGGPGYKFQDEINQHKLVKGSFAMANSGPNTNGSQFFIVTANAVSWLDGKHANFGYVSDGMDVIEKIEKVKVNENDHPAEDVVINNIELVKSEPVESAPEPEAAESEIEKTSASSTEQF